MPGCACPGAENQPLPDPGVWVGRGLQGREGKEAGAPADKAGPGRGKGMKGNQKEKSP